MNKTIWTYWHQGFDKAPWLVKNCILHWRQLHPDWAIHLLDAQTVKDFVEPLPIRKDILNKMLLPHRSDLIRTQLLIKYGGVWADPTTFCTVSLNTWIENNLSTGLFLYRNPARDRIISNWFIAATVNQPLLMQLFDQLCNYWNNHDFRNFNRNKVSVTEAWANKILNRNLRLPRIWFSSIMTNGFKLFPYMVYHYQFYELYVKNSKFKKQIDEMPFQSAELPHSLKRAGLLNPINKKLKAEIDLKVIPIYKLEWKINCDEDQLPSNSVLAYLMSTTK